MLKVLRGDAYAGITNAGDNLLVLRGHRDGHGAACVCVLDGIAHQVVPQLFDVLGVG